MKKALALLLLLIVVAMVVFAGCGGKQEAGGTEEDKVSVESSEEGQGGKITVEGEEGETTYEVGEERIPTEEELGAPIYPGAAYVPGSGLPMKVNTSSGEVTMINAEFTTKDTLKKVTEWYKGQLGEPPVISDEETSWMFENQAGEITTVILKPEGNTVRITISKLSGAQNLNSSGQ